MDFQQFNVWLTLTAVIIKGKNGQLYDLNAYFMEKKTWFKTVLTFQCNQDCIFCPWSKTPPDRLALVLFKRSTEHDALWDVVRSLTQWQRKGGSKRGDLILNRREDSNNHDIVNRLYLFHCITLCCHYDSSVDANLIIKWSLSCIKYKIL